MNTETIGETKAMWSWYVVLDEATEMCNFIGYSNDLSISFHIAFKLDSDIF